VTETFQAAKAAQRALADTMRLEVMRYSCPKYAYVVQCAFAHNFITSSLLEKLKHKPGLTKRIEETDGELADLERRFPYAEKIAPDIVAAVESNEFAVMDRQFIPQLLWANIIGSSPKRGWGIVHSILAFLSGYFIFPMVRRSIEKQCKEDNVYRKQSGL
jgi:3-dehydrosphinganine reductase